MIDFNKALGVWFYTIPPEGSYLGALTQEEGRLIFRWRFADPSGKRWYQGAPPRPLAETIEEIRAIMRLAAHVAQLKEAPSELVRGDMPLDDWLRLIMTQPWAHVVSVSPHAGRA